MPSSPISILHGQLEDIPENLHSFVTPESIFQALAAFPDHRKPRGIRHQLAWILAVALCAVLAGAKSFAAIADWSTYAASTSLRTTGFTAPHVTTFQRVLARLDAEAFDQALGAWMQTQVDARIIAIDGKEVRGAKNGGADRVHLMAALDHDTGTVLGQVDVGVKTNEITRLDSILETLGDLDGRIITIDALHTLGRHAEFLHARRAHFLMTVKGNQPKLLKQLQALPWKEVPWGNQQQDTGHGRRSIRRIKVATLTGGIKFPHALQAAQLTRKTRPLKGTKWSIEVVYLITSLPAHRASPRQLNTWIRGHWKIENSLHWCRDVTFQEDVSQTRTGVAPRVMASLRNLALSLHRLNHSTNIAKANRYMAKHPARPLERIGFMTPSATLH
ncbi:ISAs1 family transposase [Arthrobacter sp. AQ5-05]|uniref:ISAs1 family transposase n=1 Tax=Arthrobacter sp. AQ5-05 TaxID=2184581 RepID=UPI001C654B2E|nr:ISAs1 family transposase [Arthrobacter sp. AQ5-05]